MDWNKFNMPNMPSFNNIPPKFPDIPRLSIPEPLKLPQLKLSNPKLREALNEEREQINKMVSEAYYNTEQIFHFRNSIINNPEYSDLVSKSIYIAIFLTIFCIAIPLLVLPIDHSLKLVELFKHIFINLFTVKGLFVMTMIILVCGVFLVFWARNINMKYTQQDLDLLEEWMELGNYSKYLKNYIENISSSNSDDN